MQSANMEIRSNSVPVYVQNGLVLWIKFNSYNKFGCKFSTRYKEKSKHRLQRVCTLFFTFVRRQKHIQTRISSCVLLHFQVTSRISNLKKCVFTTRSLLLYSSPVLLHLFSFKMIFFFPSSNAQFSLIFKTTQLQTSSW